MIFHHDYGDSTVAGENVSYKVTVQNVRRAAELTDEWVAKNTDYTTVDEYKEGVRAQLEQVRRIPPRSAEKHSLEHSPGELRGEGIPTGRPGQCCF